MARKHTYTPQRTFDTDLDGLMRLLSGLGFTCSHIDIEQCKQDVLDQRKSRAEHDALEARYLETHARFQLEQRERHKRYLQVLVAARGAFRDDKAVLAALQNFSRKGTRHSANAETRRPTSDLPLPLPQTATA